MGELLSGGEGQFRTQGVGTSGTVGGGHGAASSVSEALDTDLDAYLDRELFVGQGAEPVVRVEKPAAAASGSMRALLDLAEEESDWLETLPPPAAPSVELKPEPVEPPVVIPEWMRAAPGTGVPAASATETAAHVLHESAVAGLLGGSAAGTDVSGMPMTPWSVPATPEPSTAHATRAPTFAGNLLPGIPPPPPVAPWAPPLAHAPQPWSQSVPMAPHASQAWGQPVPVEPRRILGMKPGSFLGAAAVGALAAGLLVVAGLHYRDSVTGARPSLAVTVATATQVAPGTSSLNGASASGSTGIPAGAVQPGAPDAMGAIASGSTGLVSPGGTGVLQPGATGTQLPAGTAGAQFGATGALPPGTTGTADPSMQQAAASVAGTVMSTAQGDVRGAADSLRAAQPTEPASGGTVLTGGKVTTTVATRETPARKKPRAAPAPTVVTEDEAAPTEESPEPATGELSFDESEASASDGDTEAPGTRVAVSSTQARPPGKYSDLDEDFARELGFTEDAESKGEEDPRAQRTVYIPPAPDAKEHLTPDDVKQVVVTNQPAITACIRQHAEGTPVEGGGRFLVKWSVLPSGDTAQVSMDTDTLRATPLARCIEDVVRRWKFPAHRARMQEPIRFPFVF